MTTRIPQGFEDTVAPMQATHTAILEALAKHNLGFAAYPVFDRPGNPRGAAAARAYPMQGILKYHGLSDWDWRISYLPSISVSNDAGYSLTCVEFDPDLAADTVVIGGQMAQGRDFERVRQSLDAVRAIAQVASRARVTSHNVVRASTTGKGLGSSASASAALALAAIEALLGPEASGNARFVSAMSRLLAGSGCRTAVGGVSLWLSYPGIAHEDSFALRLDTVGQLDDLQLITTPINSRVGLKTELAHKDAPHSSFFKSWMLNRRDEVIACIDAVQAGDWRTLGQFAELDSMRLHGVTMSGSRENKLIGWEPENIALFRMCNDLRAEGVPVYASTDTGPTVVFMTLKDYADAVVAKIASLNLGIDIIRGGIGGPAQLVDLDEARSELGVA